MRSKEDIIKDIDHMIGRHYDLSVKKEPLTELEVKELRGWGIKIQFLNMGGLEGMSLKEYMSLTERDWGDKAQKEIKEGKRKLDNRTEEEIKNDTNKERKR